MMKTFDLHDQQINQGSIIEDIQNNSIKMQKKEGNGEASQPLKKSMYVDIVEQPKLQDKHKIVIVPTIVIFKDGEEIKRYQNSFHPKYTYLLTDTSFDILTSL